MRFGILGPIEVRDGDEVLSLGGPKLRAPLAMLLAATVASGAARGQVEPDRLGERLLATARSEAASSNENWERAVAAGLGLGWEESIELGLKVGVTGLQAR
jgi:hypothetical protein